MKVARVAVTGTTGERAPVAAPPRPLRVAPVRALPGWYAAASAVAAGLALLVAFPPYGLWWLAPVGVALLDVAARGQRVRVGAGLGVLCGLALFAPLLHWTALHVGATPWLLLSGLQAAYLGLLGGGLALASPVVWRLRWAGPVVTGLLWVGQEALRARTPFGGFPWGRLAFSQSGSPLLPVASLGGAPAVTFVAALLGGLIAAALVGLCRVRSVSGRALVRPAGWLLAALALIAAAAAVPVGSRPGRAVTVAVVQGNVPRLGFDFNEQRRAVLDNHVAGTLALAEQVDAGRLPRPDLVVWPENASDIDPLANADAGAGIDRAAAAIGVPILVGALLDDGDSGVRNVGLVWQPGRGVTGTYVKRHPVPFAEYIPLRPVARLVSAEVDRVSRNFVGGDRAGVLDPGPVRVGDVICFEVAYDGLVRDTVTGGGELLVVQTNNATFNAAEARQQLAMVQLRAVEHGRDAVMASTVGVSALVTADGRAHGVTGFNVPAVTIRELTAGSARTLASRVGAAPEWVLVGLALLVLVAAGVGRVRAGRPGRAGGQERPAGRAEPEACVAHDDAGDMSAVAQGDARDMSAVAAGGGTDREGEQ